MKKILLSVSVLILLISPELKSQWFIQNSGNVNNFSALWAIDGNNVYAATQYALYKTSNGGANWSITLTDAAYFDDVQFFNVNTGYTIARASGGAKFYKTTNAGASWSIVSTIPVLTKFSISFPNQLTGFASTFGGIYRTLDGGLNWENRYGGPTNFTSLFFIDTDTGIFTSDIGNLQRCVDGGTLFPGISITPGYSQHAVFYINHQTGWFVTDKSRVYKTTTAWNPWTFHEINTPNCELDGVYFADDQTGWVCGCQGSIHRSTDGGNTWEQQTTGTTTKLVDIKFINNLTGWAVGENGRILNTTNGGVTPVGVQPVINEVPEQFELHQNYPNPFNPVTKIKFDITKVSFIKISVYDVLGNEVAEPVNVIMNPGIYETGFDGVDLPSGAYFYKISVSDPGSSSGNLYTATKKMVLLK